LIKTLEIENELRKLRKLINSIRVLRIRFCDDGEYMECDKSKLIEMRKIIDDIRADIYEIIDIY